MGKLYKIIGWGFVIIYLILMMAFIPEKRNSIPCHHVVINVLDSASNGFVSSADIQELLYKNKFEILGYPVNNINTELIENIVLNHPAVKNCEVYTMASGNLVIEVTQRYPILRIFDEKGNTYYIDLDGAIIPYSEKFVSHILVASGKIPGPENINEPFELVGSKEITNEPILDQIYTLGRYIFMDDFFKNQFVQIYINRQNEIELIPRVGSHIIIIGNLDDYKTKLENLKAMYEIGFKSKDWNDYININLKYKNQVICSKR